MQRVLLQSREKCCRGRGKETKIGEEEIRSDLGLLGIYREERSAKWAGLRVSLPFPKSNHLSIRLIINGRDFRRFDAPLDEESLPQWLNSRSKAAFLRSPR
ncbi:hypothetical protein MRB53_017834 [Persea americana]|uniref:Uncharacterized protein n=1 Tax=Persea americana TaxID=3435 RepID=A0ACC2M681_PERAE|nr:hypothetical protein MRB53_017834 [Persea americana]